MSSCAGAKTGFRQQSTELKKDNIMKTLEIKGDWNIAKGKLKQKWGNLTDDDLKYEQGKEEELIGRIQKRTSQSREAIEDALKKSCEC